MRLRVAQLLTPRVCGPRQPVQLRIAGWLVVKDGESNLNTYNVLRLALPLLSAGEKLRSLDYNGYILSHDQQLLTLSGFQQYLVLQLEDNPNNRPSTCSSTSTSVSQISTKVLVPSGAVSSADAAEGRGNAGRVKVLIEDACHAKIEVSRQDQCFCFLAVVCIQSSLAGATCISDVCWLAIGQRVELL